MFYLVISQNLPFFQHLWLWLEIHLFFLCAFIWAIFWMSTPHPIVHASRVTPFPSIPTFNLCHLILPYHLAWSLYLVILGSPDFTCPSILSCRDPKSPEFTLGNCPPLKRCPLKPARLSWSLVISLSTSHPQSWMLPIFCWIALFGIFH